MAPTFPRAHLALGKALLQDGKVPEAISELQEAARLDPQSGEAHYQLGLAMARAGRKDEARPNYKRDANFLPRTIAIRMSTWISPKAATHSTRAIWIKPPTKFQHAIKLQPESSDAQRYLGIVLEKQGDISGASAAYKKAAGSQSWRCGAPTEKLQEVLGSRVDKRRFRTAKPADSKSYIRDGRFKEAQPLAAAYVEQHPKSSWGWYALGYSLFAQQKIGESIQALAKSLQLDVKNAEAHKILGRDLMIIGRFDAAQVEFEQGIRYDPKSAEMHYNLGQTIFHARQLGTGTKRIRSSFENRSLVRRGSGCTRADAGGTRRQFRCRRELRKSHRIEPRTKGKFASAHVNLSAYYNRTGDAAKGLEYANQAIALDPKSDRAWFQKAKADELQGRLNDAVDSLNQAISFNTRASSYYYVLSGVYRRLGKTKESKDALDVFTRLDKESNDLEKLRRSRANLTTTPPPPGGRRE